MRPPIAVLSGVLTGLVMAFSPASAQNLNIYYVDTEGGQSTLYVSPSGESLLVDTGNPGERDHDRLMATIRAAGVQKIDHLIITHFHIDHYGGLEALAQAIPIMNYYDHGNTSETGRGAEAFMTTYAALTNGKRHIVKPGDKIPFAGADVTVVTSATEVLKTPIAGAPGAGQANAAACSAHAPKDLSPFTDIDNDYSAGIVISFGSFRTINLGDFTWNLERELMCPNNPIGRVDLYLTSHHGLDRSGGPALVHGLQPRVAIMNNGTRKGGSAAALRVLWESPALEDVWMLHWAYNGGIETNAPGMFVANLDEPAVLANVINPPPRPAGQGGPGAPGAGPGGAGAPGAGPGGPGAPGAGPGGPGAPGAAPGGAGAPGGPGAGGPGGFGGGGGGGFGGGQAAGPATPAAHTPAFNIKVTAQQNGTFTVTNERNNFSKTYLPYN